MNVLDSIAKPFCLCGDIIKWLSKLMLAFVGSEYMMQILAWLLDLGHISLPSWLGWIISLTGYLILYDIVNKIEVLETIDAFDGYSVFSWIVAIAMLGGLILLTIYINYYDSYLGQLAFASAHLLSHVTGIGHKLAFMIVAFYVPIMLCTLSCLSLLFPLLAYRRKLANPIFVPSGVVCILLYTWSVMQKMLLVLFDLPKHDVAWQYRTMMHLLTFPETTKAFILENSTLAPILFRTVFNLIALGIVLYYVKQEVQKTLYIERMEEEQKQHEQQQAEQSHQELVENELKAQPAALGAGDDTDDELFSSLLRCFIGRVANLYDYKILYNDFKGCSPAKVAQFTKADIVSLINKDGKGKALRTHYRVPAIVNNARAFVDVQQRFGSFANYLRQKVSTYDLEQEEGLKLAAKRLAADLRKQGFKYIGPVTASVFLKANIKILKRPPLLPESETAVSHISSL